MKTRDPRWDLPRVTVDADSRSRFYDPYDLTKPPLPPDDPAAHEYMHMVDGMAGYKSWHKYGQLLSVENPQWLENIGFSPKIVQASWEKEEELSPEPIPTILNLTLPQAVELSYIHSREYQTAIENAYLSALALTYQQFQYNVRYLGAAGNTPSSTVTLFDQPGVADGLSAPNSRFGISQVLPTGGQWVAELANNTLWLFSGGKSSSSSVLAFSLTQPLLRGAGRKIQLEGLTQQERQVLYDIRNLARFRQTFFASVVVPNQASGFYGQLFVTQQIQNQRENIRALVVQIERSREIYRIAPEEPIDQLPEGFEVPPDFKEKLIVSKSERKPSLGWRSQIMTPEERESLLNLSDQPLFQAAAQELIRRVEQRGQPRPDDPATPDDSSKPVVSDNPELSRILVNLNIPRDLQSKLDVEKPPPPSLSWRGLMSDEDRTRLLSLSDDPAFQQVALDLAARVRSGTIPNDLAQLLTRLASLETGLRSLEQTLASQQDQFKFTLGLPPDMQMTIDTSLLRPFALIDPRLTDTETRLLGFVNQVSELRLDSAEDFSQQVRRLIPRVRELVQEVEQNGFEIIRNDFRRTEENLDRRLSLLDDEAQKLLVRTNLERDQFMFRDAVKKYNQLKEGFEDTSLRIEEGRIAPVDAVTRLRELREDLLQSLQSLKVIQTGLRAELIELPKFEMSIEQVVELAMENRLELMNARGNVMDARRQLEITANRLQSVLNVVAEGEIGTEPGNKPFAFRGDQSSFQAGLQFSAPLDQVLQRNNFRAAIVNYQRARRAYMQLEDSIKRDVRNEWRALAVLRPNFETTRQNLRFSGMSLDSAIEATAAP
ncbi:MAG TPA: TolC family protein, partial [Planctomycetaceae bacterium]|nr:TolC family protein [Planctomycetaceae bacterium]